MIHKVPNIEKRNGLYETFTEESVYYTFVPDAPSGFMFLVTCDK